MTRPMPLPAIWNGEMSFHPSTPPLLISLINHVYQNKYRVHISYGDPDTGFDELTEFEAFGRIGRSTGTHPIPLVIHNERSMGGGSLQTERIVRLRHTHGAVLWEHDAYHYGRIEIRALPDGEFIRGAHGVCTVGKTYNVQVLRDGEEYRRFRYLKDATAWCMRMGVDAHVISLTHRAFKRRVPPRSPKPLTSCNIPPWA